jgi:hypothetical protein
MCDWFTELTLVCACVVLGGSVRLAIQVQAVRDELRDELEIAQHRKLFGFDLLSNRQEKNAAAKMIHKGTNGQPQQR